MIKIMYVLIAIGVTAGVLSALYVNQSAPPQLLPDRTEPVGVMCTMDAMQCPDGSYVGRTGADCTFACPDVSAVPADVQSDIDAKADLIVLTTPAPLTIVESGFTIAGQARGPWYFEASFPVMLTNWDGLIIASGIATAQSDWMTTDFVPFTAMLEFTNPYTSGDPDFMKNGSLILKKDNPSGLPAQDNALEIPVHFAP